MPLRGSTKLAFFLAVKTDMRKIGCIFDDLDKSRDLELEESCTACRQFGLEAALKVISKKDSLEPERQIKN